MRSGNIADPYSPVSTTLPKIFTLLHAHMHCWTVLIYSINYFAVVSVDCQCRQTCGHSYAILKYM